MLKFDKGKAYVCDGDAALSDTTCRYARTDYGMAWHGMRLLFNFSHQSKHIMCNILN